MPIEEQAGSHSIVGSHVSQVTQSWIGVGGRPYLDGAVHTPHGTVVVLSYQGKRPYTRLDTARCGRHLIRTIWGKAYTARGLVTLAKRWARELAEGE